LQNIGDTFIVCGKAISFNFTADLYIYFPTSNKMAIIGTLPSRFSDKKTITLQRLPDSEIKRNGLTTKNEGVTSILKSLEHQSAIFFC
jgi:hypothetical protein